MATNYHNCNEELKTVINKYHDDVDVISVVGNKSDNHGNVIIKIDDGILSEKGKAMITLLNGAIMEELEEKKSTVLARAYFTDIYLKLMRDFSFELEDMLDRAERYLPNDGQYSKSYCLGWQKNIKNVSMTIHEKEKAGWMPKIKPCPFCLKDEGQTVCEDGKWTVVCGNCFGECEPQKSERQAIYEWNRMYHQKVTLAEDKKQENTFDKFNKDFDALCKKYGYAGVVTVRSDGKGGEYSWTSPFDENSSEEFLDLQLLQIRSGMDSVYNFYDDKDFEVATGKIIEQLDESRRKNLEYIMWMTQLKEYLKKQRSVPCEDNASKTD